MQAMFLTVEQWSADDLFQTPNLLTQRRLDGMEFFRGTSEAQLFGNGNEVA